MAKTVADAFIFHWVARFGCPGKITCDRGSQFKSNLLAEMSNFLGCKLNLTCSYRPQCNDIIERTHRTLKVALKAEKKTNDWLQNLPWVLLALRATPKSDHDDSSAQLTLGTTLRLPGQFFSPTDSEAPQNHSENDRNLESALSCVRTPPPVWHRNQRSYVDPRLHSANYCFIRNDGKKSLFELSCKGTYKIIPQNDKFFTFDLGDRVDKVSIDRLNLLIYCQVMKMILPYRVIHLAVSIVL